MSLIGLRVGPFEITREVRVPLDGTWFEAHRTGMKRRQPQQVLVQVLPPDATAAQHLAMQRRYEALRALEDPRLPAPVAVYEGMGALALSAPQGVALSALVDLRATEQVPLSPATLLDIALELAEVLQHAHHRNHHHGHLSPDLVTVAADGGLCVWGFGDVEDVAPATWRPPDPLGSAASDQWSLAALLVALITGRAPRGAGERPDQAPLAAVSTVESQWPALGRLLRRMLSSATDHRFPSLHPVRQELLALARKAPGTSDRRELATRLHAERPADSPSPASAATEPAEPTEPDPPTDPTLPAKSLGASAPSPREAPPRPASRPPLPDEPMPVVRPNLTDDLPEARVEDTPTRLLARTSAPSGGAPSSQAPSSAHPTAVPFTTDDTTSDHPEAASMRADSTPLDVAEAAPTEPPAAARAARPPVAVTVQLEDSEEVDADATMLFNGSMVRPADPLEERTGPTALFDADDVARLLGTASANEDEVDLGIADPYVVLDEDGIGAIRVSDDHDGPIVVLSDSTDEELPEREILEPEPSKAFTVAVVMVGAMIFAMVVWFAVGLAG